MPNSKERPKIHIPKTNSERIWDVIGYSCYLGSLIFLIYIWGDLPDQVPAHFNAKGEVDRWGSKQVLLILPIIGAFLAVLMQFIEKIPQSHNYPQRLNKENAQEFYLNSRKMTNQLKAICLIVFALIIIESVSVALEWGGGLGVWFLPIVTVGCAIPIIFGLIKQSKIR